MKQRDFNRFVIDADAHQLLEVLNEMSPLTLEQLRTLQLRVQETIDSMLFLSTVMDATSAKILSGNVLSAGPASPLPSGDIPTWDVMSGCWSVDGYSNRIIHCLLHDIAERFGNIPVSVRAWPESGSIKSAIIVSGPQDYVLNDVWATNRTEYEELRDEVLTLLWKDLEGDDEDDL